jgi:hypothetical protein
MALGNIQVKRIGQKRLTKVKSKTERSNQSVPSNRRNETTQNSTGFHLSQINHLEETIAKLVRPIFNLILSIIPYFSWFLHQISEQVQFIERFGHAARVPIQKLIE